MQILLILIAMILFIFIVSIYDVKKTEKEIKKNILDTFGKIPNENYIIQDRTAIYWREIQDHLLKEEIIDEITWNDLDMDKIFNRINHTKSFAGEQLLYAELHHIPICKNTVIELERTMDYYKSHDSVRLEMEYLLYTLGKDELSYYLPMFINDIELHHISKIWVYHILQILLFITALPPLILKEPIYWVVTVIIFLINIGIYSIKKSQYEVYMDSLSGIIRLLKLIKKVMLKSDSFCHDIPDNIKENLKKFDKLSNMISSLQMKKQAGLSGDIFGLLQDYMIGATLWDFTRYEKIISYIQGKQNEFMELYEFVARIDMAISILSFRKSLPIYCIPRFTEKRELDFQELYHPLIKIPICNSLSLSKNCLITGSNASGKSTFIKAIAVNVILAQSIHTCTAANISVPNARIITSMAIRDDISSGESYYIKEIKYLKRIIDCFADGRMVICAIDEILRGTNSDERIAASVAILVYLIKVDCIALVASHDLEIAKLLANQYNLYYFCEQLKNGDIFFDYCIHQGVSTTQNAINLLKAEGFPEEIIAVARSTEKRTIMNEKAENKPQINQNSLSEITKGLTQRAL